MEHFISASIGIAMIPADGSSVEELLRNADTAMYKAKDAGRGRCVFFEERMNLDVEERVSLRADLRHSIERGELVLYYQPKVDLETEEIIGAEALMRWNHPKRGLLSPDSFIPIAEDTGLIVEIGEWLIGESTRQLSVWQKRGVLDELSINVSYRQIRDSDFAQSLAQYINENELDPSTLEIEITESVIADDMDHIVTTLNALRGIGVPVAIDDFGTGYSSFSYLTELPFDTLKIDKSFLTDFPEIRDRTAIVAAIIQIGTVLGKTIVAEGIETREQALGLLRHGCRVAQGYLFSRPLTVRDFEAYSAEHSAVLQKFG
jgi:EAL domain-containing protein (putative c-di-GMP-specific phosphodiesterase class I)